MIHPMRPQRRSAMSPNFNKAPRGFSDTGTMDHEMVRGRKRDRSMTRASVKSFRPDESSTLRGRSRRRATSPYGYVSRNASPSLASPNRQRLLHDRLRDMRDLRDSRREHCPSRPVSPSGRSRPSRRQRTKSRSRDSVVEQDFPRTLDSLSSLRNEVLVEDELDGKERNRQYTRQ